MSTVRSPQASHQMEIGYVPGENDSKKKLGRASDTAGDIYVDREMRDAASGLRKKRSRNHFDAEVDREQKILATEGTKAQRQSDELERRDSVGVSDVNKTAIETGMKSEHAPNHRAVSSPSINNRPGYGGVCTVK